MGCRLWGHTELDTTEAATAAAAAAKSLQSCPTLCDPIDGSPPGSSVLWILQTRILEWVAVSSSATAAKPRHIFTLLHSID